MRMSTNCVSSIQISTTSIRLTVLDPVNMQVLLKLGPTDMDNAARPECLPNTCMDILTEIFTWVSMPTTKTNVYWLYSFPGTGKSTIATSVANIFQDLCHLDAFTFFIQGVAACCYNQLSARDLFSPHSFLTSYASLRTLSVSRGLVYILVRTSMLLLCALSSGCPYPCSTSALHFLIGVGSLL